jgi:hypothetical protein
MFGGEGAELQTAIRYAKTHGGGTIGVESQSSAAAAILASNANVAGLGGFSGRESSVTATWLAQEVAEGRLRWLLLSGGASGGMGLPGDTRSGSTQAFDIVAKACRSVSLPFTATTAGGAGTGSTSAGAGTGSPAGGAGTGLPAGGGLGSAGTTTLYDCDGKAAAIRAAAG